MTNVLDFLVIGVWSFVICQPGGIHLKVSSRFLRLLDLANTEVDTTDCHPASKIYRFNAVWRLSLSALIAKRASK